MGADETWFGQYIFLVLMELTSGFIFTEALVNNRSYQTWCKATKGVLKYLKKIISFTTDSGKAIIKLGKKCKCKNGMDLFHLLQDMKKLFATKFHSKRLSLQSQLKKLQEYPLENEKEQKAAIATVHQKLKTIDKGQQDYRKGLFSVSVLTHPFKNISEKKTSKELEKQLHTELKKFRSIAQVCEIKDKENLLDRFGNRIEAAAQLNDSWHLWVEQSVLCKTNNPAIKEWATEFLLPYFYYKEQLRKAKKKALLRNHYKKVLKKSKKILYAHPLSKEYLHDDWISWAQSMALKYQRSNSAIEGRNARLTQHYFAARGIRRSHINSLTVLHNFWIKRKDKTTAAERLCSFKPPDLFEYILENMGAIPLPRKRKSKMALAI